MPAFSKSLADSALQAACEQADLDVESARLLRIGENAIYAVEKQQVVIRIARSGERLARAKKELCIARWLQTAGVPAVQVYEEIDQPIVAMGLPVTFWRLLHELEPKPRHRDLAQLLAQFHSFDRCPCELPDFHPLALVKARITSAHGVSPENKNFLIRHHDELQERYKSLRFALPQGVIHGDARPGNLMRDERGIVLLDFEMSALGP